MTDAPRDPYRVLGVAPTATDAEITVAYRTLVRHLHPDADPGANHDAAPRELAQVLAAYRLLRDPERRAAYDREHGRTSGTQHRTTAQHRTTVTPTHTREPRDVPVQHHHGRPPDLRVGPVRRHR